MMNVFFEVDSRGLISLLLKRSVSFRVVFQIHPRAGGGGIGEDRRRTPQTAQTGCKRLVGGFFVSMSVCRVSEHLACGHTTPPF